MHSVGVMHVDTQKFQVPLLTSHNRCKGIGMRQLRKGGSKGGEEKEVHKEEW